MTKQENAQFTFKEFLNNPMGKGKGAMQFNAIRNDFNRRYTILKEKGREPKCEGVYKDGSSYYLHISVPSEDLKIPKEFFYDVVIEFYPADLRRAAEAVINNYKIRFFSNCPSFVFTYAFVYEEAGLIIPEFKDKYRKEVFGLEPEVKNPYEIINIDKSLFFALLYLERHGAIFFKANLDGRNTGLKFKQLLQRCRRDIQILSEREEEVKKIRRSKRENENKQKKDINERLKEERMKTDPKSFGGVGLIKPKKTITSSSSKVNTINKKTGTKNKTVGSIKGRKKI